MSNTNKYISAVRSYEKTLSICKMSQHMKMKKKKIVYT